MAKPYFRQVPNFDYVSRNPGEKYISEYIQVKNLFKRGKLREDIFGNLAFFERYSVLGGERPDNVANKFYGDSTLDWVVLLSNNILNIQTEWPLEQSVFDKVMLERYGSYDRLYDVHHYETNEIRNSLGITVLKGGIKISPSWKTSGNFIESINSTITEITATDKTVRVDMENNIPGVLAGGQVTIDGVSEREYNGKFLVKEIFDKAFTYELPAVPKISKPKISTSRKEQVVFEFDSPFSVIGTIENASDQLLQNEFPNAISGNVVIDSLTGNSWTYNGFTWIDEPTLKSLNSYYYEYWDDGLGYSTIVPSTTLVREVTNFEYEFNLNEAKRNIYILKPRYLNIVFNDMDNIMSYKKGSQQYVSENLKRGDNIRLYE